jgi:hypothetical protein
MTRKYGKNLRPACSDQEQPSGDGWTLLETCLGCRNAWSGRESGMLTRPQIGTVLPPQRRKRRAFLPTSLTAPESSRGAEELISPAKASCDQMS